MNELPSLSWPAYGWGLLAVGGVFVSVLLIVFDPESHFRKQWESYILFLDTKQQFLFAKTSGRVVATRQLWGGLFLAVVSIFANDPMWLVLTLLVWMLPPVILQARTRKRIKEIEKQLEGWLTLLANALRATSSIGEAIASTIEIVEPPIKQELDLCVKEMRLGLPVHESLLQMSRRLQSFSVSAALTSLLVARNTGGNLPATLDRAAAALKELNRLESHIRGKLADQKMGFFLFAFTGPLMALLILIFFPQWFSSAVTTPGGQVFYVTSGLVWAIAFYAGLKAIRIDV